MSSNTTLTVSVIDVNDNPPQFNATGYSFEILENLPARSQAGVFTVTDRDSGLAAEYTFTLSGQGSDRFSVEIVNVTQMSNANSQPPVVTLARIVASQPLDREDAMAYELTLTARDRSSSPLMGSVPVNVTVLDVNDNDPRFPQPSYTFTISEGTINLSIINLTVSQYKRAAVPMS